MEFVTFSTKFWTDPYVRKLEPEHKLLYAYLFTNGQVEYGFQERDLDLWQLWTKLTAEQITAGLEQFAADGKVMIEGETIFVVNALRHLRLGGKNLTGALNRIQAVWGPKAPRAVAECMRRYNRAEPGPTGSGEEGGTNMASAPVSTQPDGVTKQAEREKKENQPKETTQKATASRRSQAEERRLKRLEIEHENANKLAELEKQLPLKSVPTWEALKLGMAQENDSGEQASSVPLRLLTEVLGVITDDQLTPDAVVHGFEACLHPASGGVAGNKTYFRKAANGYKPPRTGPIFEGSRGPGSGSPMGRSISTDYKDTELVDEPA